MHGPCGAGRTAVPAWAVYFQWGLSNRQRAFDGLADVGPYKIACYCQDAFGGMHVGGAKTADIVDLDRLDTFQRALSRATVGLRKAKSLEFVEATMRGFVFECAQVLESQLSRVFELILGQVRMPHHMAIQFNRLLKPTAGHSATERRVMRGDRTAAFGTEEV